MAQGADKQLQHIVNVKGARPYGPVGLHDGAVNLTRSPMGKGVPYISDTPYVPPTLPYAERPTCVGKRRNGEPCKAKAAASGSPFCEAHTDQE